MSINEEGKKPKKKEYYDMPEVRIDSDDQEKFRQTNNKKIFVILGLVIAVLAVTVFGYSLLEKTFFSPDKEDKPTEKQSQVISKDEKEDTEKTDSTKPEFVGFQERIVVEQNALDVDLSKYFLALDQGQKAKITTSGNVDFTTEGEYPITVIAEDASGNKTEQSATVQVISENTMATGIEFSCYLDGSIPLEEGTKQRLLANVIYFYYQEVPAEISKALQEFNIDVSGYATETTWNPSVLNQG